MQKFIFSVFAVCTAGMNVHAAEVGSAEVETGLALYNDFGCYQCHGLYGQGGNAGPKLAPDPLPFEAFQVIVRRPVAKMPPYTEKVLSAEQLKSMHAYLQSLEKTAPASEVDLLDLSIQPASEMPVSE